MCKITTNYNRKDWFSVSLKLLVQLVLPVLGGLFIIFTLVMPMLNVMEVIAPELTQTWVVEHIRDVGMDNGFTLNTILLYYVFTISGGIIIPLFILFWSLGRLMALGEWFVKGITLDNITFFWDGVSTSETKWGKKIIAFDNLGKKKDKNIK